MKMKRIALLLACILLATMVLTACSADPKGTWVLTSVRNDDTGTWQSIIEDYESVGGNITAVISSNRVTITGNYLGYSDELINFRYNQHGNSMIDPADNSEVTFRISGDKLTLIFADCELIFTRSN